MNRNIYFLFNILITFFMISFFQLFFGQGVPNRHPTQEISRTCTRDENDDSD